MRMKLAVKCKEERTKQADSAAAAARKNLLLICLCSGEPGAQVPLTTSATGGARIPPHLRSGIRSHARVKQQTCTHSTKINGTGGFIWHHPAATMQQNCKTPDRNSLDLSRSGGVDKCRVQKAKGHFSNASATKGRLNDVRLTAGEAGGLPLIYWTTETIRLSAGTIWMGCQRNTEHVGLEKRSIMGKYSSTIKHENLEWVHMMHSKHIFLL